MPAEVGCDIILLHVAFKSNRPWYFRQQMSMNKIGLYP